MSDKEHPINKGQNLKPKKSLTAIKAAYGLAAVLIVGSLCFMAYTFGQKSVQQSLAKEKTIQKKEIYEQQPKEDKSGKENAINYSKMVEQFKKNPTLGKATFLSKELNEDPDKYKKEINECSDIIKNLIETSSNLSLRDRIQYIEAFPQNTQAYLPVYKQVYDIFEDTKIKVFKYEDKKEDVNLFIETIYSIGPKGWININLQELSQRTDAKDEENLIKNQIVHPEISDNKLILNINETASPIEIQLFKDSLLFKQNGKEQDYDLIKEANTLERYKAKYDMNIRMSSNKDSNTSSKGIKQNQTILIIYKEEKEDSTWGWLANGQGWVCIKEGNQRYLDLIEGNYSVNV